MIWGIEVAKEKLFFAICLWFSIFKVGLRAASEVEANGEGYFSFWVKIDCSSTFVDRELITNNFN